MERGRAVIHMAYPNYTDDGYHGACHDCDWTGPLHPLCAEGKNMARHDAVMHEADASRNCPPHDDEDGVQDLRERVARAEGMVTGIRANARRLSFEGRSCIAVPDDQLAYLGGLLAGNTKAVEFGTASG